MSNTYPPKPRTSQADEREDLLRYLSEVQKLAARDPAQYEQLKSKFMREYLDQLVTKSYGETRPQLYPAHVKRPGHKLLLPRQFLDNATCGRTAQRLAYRYRHDVYNRFEPIRNAFYDPNSVF